MKSSADVQTDIAVSLCTEVAKMSRQLRHMELPPGFTPARLQTLTAIYAHGPISVTALAAIERVQPATVSRMVAALEDGGLVRRRTDRLDKRSVLVSTTAKGRQMYLRANRLFLRRINEALASLNEEQLEILRALADVLEELNTALRD